MAEKKKLDYMVKTRVMEAEGTWWQWPLKKTPIKGKIMSRVWQSLASSMPCKPYRVKRQLRSWPLLEERKSVWRRVAEDCC